MPDHVRLSEALLRFEAMRASRCSATTVKNDSFVLRRFLDWLGEDLQVRHLRAARVEEWFYGPEGLRAPHTTRDGIVRPPVQASTHNYYRSRIKAFLHSCVVCPGPQLLVDPSGVTRRLPAYMTLSASRGDGIRAFLAEAQRH